MSQRLFERSVRRTNEAFAAFGVSVQIDSVRLLPGGFAELHRYRQRRALARLAPPDGTIHVFVVDSLDPFAKIRIGNKVRGMHWTYRGLRRAIRGREYLIVATDAPSTTLAHELGHLFGLPHSRSTQNIMCSCREGPDTSFTQSQGRRVRRVAARFDRRRRIRLQPY